MINWATFLLFRKCNKKPFNFVKNKNNMHSKGMIILGSARSKGNSYQIAQQLHTTTQFPLFNLNEYHIAPFNYEKLYPKDDDFQVIAQEMLKKDYIILITPIYWYTVSTAMKIFMDRLTDLITIHKKQGRQLKGKCLFSISCGPDDDMPPFFHEPFRLTAEYLDMQYGGYVHTWVEENEPVRDEILQRLQHFTAMIKRST